MGSINDYLRHRRTDEQPRTRRFKGRILGQISLSLVLFLIIAASVQADNIFGQSARYVMEEGIAASSSWIDFDGTSTDKTDTATDNDKTGNADSDQVNTPVEDVFPADDSAPPDFTAPASGVVVTDVAVEAGGFASSSGILIQGNAGQKVKSAADGSVASVAEGNNGFVLEITHSGGFTSLYQGLSQSDVKEGDQVRAGDQIGATADGELTFSLMLNGTEVDPLEYLFE